MSSSPTEASPPPLPPSPNGQCESPHEDFSESDPPATKKANESPLQDIPYPPSSDPEAKERSEAEMEIPLPPDSSDNKYSPTQATLEDGSPSSETQQQPKKVVKVLGHAQAKKRLQAFSAAKLAAVSAPIVKKSPLKGVSVFSGRKDDSSKQPPPLAIASIKEEETKMREILAMNTILNEKLKTVHAITSNLPVGPGPVTAIVKPTVIHSEFRKPPEKQEDDEIKNKEKLLVVKKQRQNIRQKRASSSSSSASSSRSVSPKRRDKGSKEVDAEKEQDSKRQGGKQRDSDRRRRSRSTSKSRGSRQRSVSPTVKQPSRSKRSPERKVGRNQDHRGTSRSRSRERDYRRAKASPKRNRSPSPPPPRSKKLKEVAPPARGRDRSRSRSRSQDNHRQRNRSRSRDRNRKRDSPAFAGKEREGNRDRLPERERSKQSRQEERQREEAKNEQRREREKLEAAERELDKMRSSKMPEDWAEYKKYKYSTEHIRTVWNTIMGHDHSSRKSQSNSKSSSRNTTVDDGPPLSLAAALNNPPAQIRTVQVELKNNEKGDYPAFCVKTTAQKPPLEYGCNPLSFAGYYKSREQIFKEESPSVVKMLLEIIDGATKLAAASSSVRSAQDWFAASAKMFCPTEGSKAVVISHLYSDEEVDDMSSPNVTTAEKSAVRDRSPEKTALIATIDQRSGVDSAEEASSSESSGDSVPSPLLKQEYEKELAKDVSRSDDVQSRSHEDEESDEEAPVRHEVLVVSKAEEKKKSKKEKKEKKKRKESKRSHRHRSSRKHGKKKEEMEEKELSLSHSGSEEDREDDKKAKHVKKVDESQVESKKKSSSKKKKHSHSKKAAKKRKLSTPASSDSDKSSSSESSSESSSSSDSEETKKKKQKRKKKRKKKEKSRKNGDSSSDEEDDDEGGGNAGGSSGRGGGGGSTSGHRDKGHRKHEDSNRDRGKDRKEKRKDKSRHKHREHDQGVDSPPADNSMSLSDSESGTTSTESRSTASTTSHTSSDFTQNVELVPQLELSLEELIEEDKTDKQVYKHLLKTASVDSCEKTSGNSQDKYDPFQNFEEEEVANDLVRNEPYRNPEQPTLNNEILDIETEDFLKSLDNDPLLQLVSNKQPVSAENLLASISETDTVLQPEKTKEDSLTADYVNEKVKFTLTPSVNLLETKAPKWTEADLPADIPVKAGAAPYAGRRHSISPKRSMNNVAQDNTNLGPRRSYSRSRSRSPSASPRHQRWSRRSRSASISPPPRRSRRSLSRSLSPSERRRTGSPRRSRSISPRGRPYRRSRSRSRSHSPAARPYPKSRKRPYIPRDRYGGRRGRRAYDSDDYYEEERDRRRPEAYYRGRHRDYSRDQSPENRRMRRMHDKYPPEDDYYYKDRMHDEKELPEGISNVHPFAPPCEMREASPVLKFNAADSTISDSELAGEGVPLGFPAVVDDSRATRSNLKQIPLEPEPVLDSVPGYASPHKRLSLDERLELEMGIKITEPSNDNMPPFFNLRRNMPGGTGNPNTMQEANQPVEAGVPTQSKAIPLGNLIQVLPAQLLDRPFTVTKEMSKLNPFEVQQTAVQVIRKEGDEVDPNKCLMVKVPVLPFKIPAFIHPDSQLSGKENRENRRSRRERRRLEKRKKEKLLAKRKLLEKKRRNSKMNLERGPEECDGGVQIKEEKVLPMPMDSTDTSDLVEKIPEEAKPTATEDSKALKEDCLPADLVPEDSTGAVAEVTNETPTVENNRVPGVETEQEKPIDEQNSQLTQGTEETVKEEVVDTSNKPPTPSENENVPLRGILYISGLKKDKNNKAVKFADGVVPGDGSSLSEGEEIHSPPLLPTNGEPTANPKKRLKQKLGKKKRKSKKMKLAKNGVAITVPPPPPPASSYPYCPLGILYQFNPPYAIVYAQALAELGFEVTFTPSMECPADFAGEKQESASSQVTDQPVDDPIVSLETPSKKHVKRNEEEPIGDVGSTEGETMVSSSSSSAMKRKQHDTPKHEAVQSIPTIVGVANPGTRAKSSLQKSRTLSPATPKLVKGEGDERQVVGLEECDAGRNKPRKHTKQVLSYSSKSLANSIALGQAETVGPAGNPILPFQMSLPDKSYGQAVEGCEPYQYQDSNLQTTPQPADHHMTGFPLSHDSAHHLGRKRVGRSSRDRSGNVGTDNRNPNLIPISPVASSPLKLAKLSNVGEANKTPDETAGSHFGGTDPIGTVRAVETPSDITSLPATSPGISPSTITASATRTDFLPVAQVEQYKEGSKISTVLSTGLAREKHLSNRTPRDSIPTASVCPAFITPLRVPDVRISSPKPRMPFDSS